MFSLFKRKNAAESAKTHAADDPNSAEANAAMFIKAKCEVGTLFARRLADPEEDYADQLARYEKVRNECICLADRIDDEFYRGFAIHQIIDMCIVANDVGVARALLVSVRDAFLRDKILETAPALGSA